MLISILNGSREKVYADLHRKYGPIVRLSHDELIFIDPDAWKDVSENAYSLPWIPGKHLLRQFSLFHPGVCTTCTRYFGLLCIH